MLRQRQAESRPRLIGGFFELDPGPPLGQASHASQSVAALWFERAQDVTAFRNARSALAYGILPALMPRTLWLPTFCCNSLDEASAHCGAFQRYPLAPDGSLEPDAAWLDQHIEPGDAVLVVDYFGRKPSDDFCAYTASRPDITWIEDRAQALWPGAPWGDVVLYSPRKLLGVGEGGYAVVPHRQAARRLHEPLGAAPPDPAVPAFLARFEDAIEGRNGEWFSAYQESERAMQTAPTPASRLSQALLWRIDAGSVAQRRRRNFRALLSALAPGAVLDGYGVEPTEEWVPQGVPVLVPEARAAVASMAAAGVFCAQLWPSLQQSEICRRTNELRGRLIMLPCDHRYDPMDMVRVAAAFADVASPGGRR